MRFCFKIIDNKPYAFLVSHIKIAYVKLVSDVPCKFVQQITLSRRVLDNSFKEKNRADNNKQDQ